MEEAGTIFWPPAVTFWGLQPALEKARSLAGAVHSAAGKEVTHLCLNVERRRRLEREQHRVSLYMPKCVYVYRVRGGAIMLCKSFGCFHFWRPAWGLPAMPCLPTMPCHTARRLVTKPWLNQKYVGLS